MVYPPELRQREWFAHYASLFDTVEINATFYRLPAPHAVDVWAAQAPPGFAYSVKVGQFGSHRMKLLDPARWLANHLDRVRRLGAHLGPNLVQLPPSWKRNAERLDEFLTVAPRDIRWAVEVRDPSWLHDDVFAVLERHRAALCIHDMLPDHPWVLTTNWTYVRFHGPAGATNKYHGRYGPRRLATPVRKLRTWTDAGVDVYAYFNNDYGGLAVADARWMRSKLAADDPRGARAD